MRKIKRSSKARVVVPLWMTKDCFGEYHFYQWSDEARDEGIGEPVRVEIPLAESE